MNYEQAMQKLTNIGQQHLLNYYNELTEKEQKDLLHQIEETDFSVIRFLDTRKDGLERGKIEPLKAMQLEEIMSKEKQLTEKGLEAIRGGRVGAVLLAGGMGTRLGSDAPKGVYNIGVTKDLYIFECLVRNLMRVTEQAGNPIYLFVMTSDKNHDTTVAFFKEHAYFGYPEEFIRFFKQEMAPAVDYGGKVYLEEKGKISTSPNGNGGWFVSMDRSGILDIVHSTGIEWLNVFAVDNVLQNIADPAFVGACEESGCMVGAKVVRKANPDEKVGVMCLEDGKPSIVEYYELTDEMRHQKDENGDYAYNFGVILNYLFRVSELERIMSHELPLHVVEKKIAYVDADGNPMKPDEPNGYKFEQLVLDMIHDMETCLPYEVVREKEFAPIKNKEGVDSVETARALLEKNGVIL
ncbi:MAG: UDPGP type 1 family protein [Lachnospiraceae bacterium]|nr:UDPGP type 1 family protein [Lachnospiraceae bacterium]